MPQKPENNIFVIKTALVSKGGRGDYHMASAARTKTFPGFDGKTEDAIDAAVNARWPP